MSGVNMKRVLCAGDMLVDFISATRGTGLAGATLFENRPGGSPFNIAIALARLGTPVGFLVKVGDDEFGCALRRFLTEEGVFPDYLVAGAGRVTTLAMAAVDAAGKPEFRFYRENAADASLAPDELPRIDPAGIALFQLGSIALADSPVGDALMDVFGMMRSAGVLTALDPNVRPLYVDDRPIFRARIEYLARRVDVLKLSDDDLSWLCPNARNVEEGLARLNADPSALVVLTEGAGGASAWWRGAFVSVPAFAVQVAETTGCGDAFMASLIAQIAPLGREGFASMTPDFLREVLRRANATAAIVATRVGAACAMPTSEEVACFMDEQ